LVAAVAGAGVGLVLGLLVAWLSGRTWAEGVLTLGELRVRQVAKTATILRGVVSTCAAYYVIVLVALHFLEPEFDPRSRFVSEYVWGAYGWLMTTTFFVLGLAILSVAVGLRVVHRSRNARIGFGLLVVGALFICLAGVFKGFPLHLAASAVGLPSVVMAALVLSWSFRREPVWRPIYPATSLISLGMLAAFLSIFAAVGMPGLQQRAFLFLLLLWLSITAQWSVRVASGAAWGSHS
jgi:hypothetical membrane protein